MDKVPVQPVGARQVADRTPHQTVLLSRPFWTHVHVGAADAGVAGDATSA